MDSRADAAEEVHQIHGTRISFSSKPDDLHEKAAEELREIKEKGIDGLDVLADAFDMDLQHLPKGFFVSHGTSCFNNICNKILNNQKFIWRSHGSCFGYGIGHHASGYKCFRKTFVYHKDNHKTNWFMNIYSLIYENSYIKLNDVVLCHVFQSDNYNPRPNPFAKSVPAIFDFLQEEVDSRALQLEGLLKNPESFKDSFELDEMYSKCQAKGRNGKRGEVWEYYTPIEVRGRDGEVMLTLAICHHCSMVYQTGKWDPKKKKVTNNGTNSLKEHKRKCSDH